MRGNFSQFRGKGIGLGVLIQPSEDRFNQDIFCILKDINGFKGGKNEKVYVWFRNSESRVYYPGYLEFN